MLPVGLLKLTLGVFQLNLEELQLLLLQGHILLVLMELHLQFFIILYHL